MASLLPLLSLTLLIGMLFSGVGASTTTPEAMAIVEFATRVSNTGWPTVLSLAESSLCSTSYAGIACNGFHITSMCVKGTSVTSFADHPFISESTMSSNWQQTDLTTPLNVANLNGLTYLTSFAWGDNSGFVSSPINMSLPDGLVWPSITSLSLIGGNFPGGYVIPPVLANLTSITTLTLSGPLYGAYEYDVSILANMTGVTTLNLAYMIMAPSTTMDIGFASNLTSASLVSVPVPLPSSWINMPLLTKFSVQNVGFPSFPSKINWPSLNTFDCISSLNVNWTAVAATGANIATLSIRYCTTASNPFIPNWDLLPNLVSLTAIGATYSPPPYSSLWTKIQFMSLQNVDISAMPSDWSKWSSFSTFQCVQCTLPNLSGWVDGLCNLPITAPLTTITITATTLNQVGSCMSKFAGLSTYVDVNLANNALFDFPTPILSLPLASLTLDYNNMSLSQMPDMSSVNASYPFIFSINFCGLSFNPIGRVPRTTSQVRAAGNAFLGVMPDDYFSQLVFLWIFDVTGSSMTGPFPSSIGAATQLYQLICQGNLFTSVPDSIANLTSLTTIDFSNNALTYIPGDSVWNNLEQIIQNVYLQNNPNLNLPVPTWWVNSTAVITVNISNCAFYGPIPSTIGTGGGAVNLDIHNNFITGFITEGFIAWYYQYIDLSANQISGTIPNNTFTTTTSYLTYWNSSNNLMTGTLPAFSPTRAVAQVLDLSYNSHTGPFPDLSGYYNLVWLGLNNNYFNLCSSQPMFPFTHYYGFNAFVQNNPPEQVCNCFSWYNGTVANLTYDVASCGAPGTIIPPANTPLNVPAPKSLPNPVPPPPVYNPTPFRPPTPPGVPITPISPAAPPTSNNPSPTGSSSRLNVQSMAYLMMFMTISAMATVFLF